MSFDKYKTKGAYHYEWYKTEPWYKACVDKCVEFCDDNTLDLGCGDGIVSKLLSEKLPDKWIVGYDNDETAIELAKEHAPLANFAVKDITKPLKGRWEYMVCLNVIEHLQDPEAIKRIFNRNITRRAIIITDIPQKHPSSHHIKEFTPYELSQMFYTRKVIPFKIDDNFHGIEIYK